MAWIKTKEGTFLWEGKVPVPTETWEWIEEEGEDEPLGTAP
mgnify:CR=1 FL=1